ncbi:unnamed protein product [Arctia plantaginis]|uniref:Uncharacterized protein n=1 Tax=Arctia plantaginis TaxID=874455 RepID=A0A8S0YTL1_ARCPL|nr:unnamed protein product [Arctia plantaginis]
MEESQLKALDSEDDDDTFINLFIDEEIQGKNERYARNVQAITESALDHLVNEIRNEYYKNNYYANSPLRKYIRKLNDEMVKKNRNELINNKRNKTLANEKKTPIKKKRAEKNKKRLKNKRKKCNGKSTDKKEKPSA